MAFLFSEYRRHGTDGRTERRVDGVQRLMRHLREGHMIAVCGSLVVVKKQLCESVARLYSTTAMAELLCARELGLRRL